MTAVASEHQQGGRAVLAALDALAAARRTGTAWLTGERAVGALYFRNGRVVGAELGGSPAAAARLMASGRLTEGDWTEFADACAVTRPQPVHAFPSAAGLDRAEWLAIGLDAVLEAAAELLPTASGQDVLNSRGDLVLQPDSVPGWTVTGCSVAFLDVQEELRRRQSVLERLKPTITPDSVVRRIAGRWSGAVQISARQWRVLRAAGTGSVPREIAAQLGAGVFATTVAVRGLIDLGMLATDGDGDAQDAFPITLHGDAVDGSRR